jgi:hypothetical protein
MDDLKKAYMIFIMLLDPVTFLQEGLKELARIEKEKRKEKEKEGR